MGRRGFHTEWGSGLSAEGLRCGRAWRKREMMLHLDSCKVAAGNESRNTAKSACSQRITQTNKIKHSACKHCE